MVLGPTHEWCLLELCNAQSAQPAALGPISHSSYIDFLLPSSPTYCMIPNWLAFHLFIQYTLLVTVSMPGHGVGTGVQWAEAGINMTKASPHPPGATPQGWRPIWEQIYTILYDKGYVRACHTIL